MAATTRVSSADGGGGWPRVKEGASQSDCLRRERLVECARGGSPAKGDGQRFDWASGDRPVETIHVAGADKDALHTESPNGLRNPISPGAEAQTAQTDGAAMVSAPSSEEGSVAVSHGGEEYSESSATTVTRSMPSPSRHSWRH